ncbi:MAG: protein kinase [Anaerolineales bacterium]|nr:protein kinase [Anaerolineales bacterium]
MVKDCALGLSVAHAEGYIHRDITPNNIFLLSDHNGERWVVSDWGLVRMHGKTTAVHTREGQGFGTMGFAAPEFWENAHDADAKADVYSLGRVVAWCTTGKWPSPNLPLVPNGDWKEFVEIATNLDPNKRFQDMTSLIGYVKNMQEKPQGSNGFSIELEDIQKISYLNTQDSLVFKTICEISISKGSNWVGLDDVQSILVENYLTESEFLESIELLADEYFISGDMTLDGKIHIFKITATGFESYSNIFIPDFENLIKQVIVTIVQQEIMDNQSISSYLDKSLILVDYALEILEARRLLTISKSVGGNIYVDDISVQGRRIARDN